MKLKDLLIAMLVILVWGLNFVVIRLTMNASMPPMLLVTLRYALIALPLLPFVKRPPVPLRYLAAYGLTLGTVHQGLLFLGIKAGMGAGLSSLVLQTQVFFTFLMAAVFLKERARPEQLAGIALAAIGLYTIATATEQAANPLAFMLVIASAITWAAATMFSKAASNRATGPVDPLAFMVWAAAFPPLPTLALAFVIDGPQAIATAMTHLSWSVAAGIAFITYGSTLFGFMVWNRLIARYGAGYVTQFSLLVPVVGMTSAAIVLGETITPVKALAALLVLAGLALAMFGGRVITRFTETIAPRGA